MNKKRCKQIDAESLRCKFLVYTRKAFLVLPEIDNPYILDIGCGSGIPTMELARLSGGQVLGIDIDQLQLDKIEEKIGKESLSDKVHTLKCSIDEMNFEDESFDIVWSEGSISVVGFEKGINEWRRLIKPKGFLVIHDSLINLDSKLEQISKSGYKLLEYFIISKDIWLKEYFLPLSKEIEYVKEYCNSESEAFHELEKYQQQIDEFEKNPELNQSVFFVMQKILTKILE
jgi:ubiquinone/menaquinone biosynthesis C-methylase UbiE